MKAATIILNFNDSLRTAKLAHEIITYKSIEKVLIVDNKSVDNSVTILKSEFSCSKIHILELDKNYGYSKGNQIGIDFIRSNFSAIDFIVIANPDVYFEENFIITVMNKLQNSNRYLLMTGLMIDDPNLTFSRFAYWRRTKYIDDLCSMFFIFRKICTTKYLKSNYAIDELIDVDTIPGSLFVIDVSKLNFQLFDTSVFLYYEEDIIAEITRRNGYRLGIVNNVSFIHNHIPLTKHGKQYRYLLESMRYYQINYNKIGLMKRLILSIAMKLSQLENGLSGLFRKRVK